MNSTDQNKKCNVRNWAHDVLSFFADHWQSVFFSSAISVILEKIGALRVLTKFSLLVISSLASQVDVGNLNFTPGTPAVVLISGADFITRYGEKNPLDRCILAQDVTNVLSKSPKRLAVDFDLSPLVNGSESEQHCQRELDALIDREAKRLVLLLPFPAASDDLLRVKQDWIQARCRAGIHFADGNIEQSMGLVTEQLTGDEPELKARMADQLHGDFSDLICQSIASTDEVRRNHWLIDQRTGVDPKSETTPINFPKVMEQLAIFTLGSAAFEGVASLENSSVFLGGDWGRDDNFLTSIGSLPGAAIHGARLVSLEHPISSLGPLFGLLGDIGIALCFAWIIERFWEAYVTARRIDLYFGRKHRRTALSALLMTTFVLIFFSLVIFFFFAAEYYFSQVGVVIAPLLIAISMLLDGFISGPIDQIKNLLQEELHSNHQSNVSLTFPIGEKIRVLLWQLVGAFSFMLCFWLISLMMPNIAGIVAGWSFAITMFVLYALLMGNAFCIRKNPFGRWPMKFVSALVRFFRPKSLPAGLAATPAWLRIYRWGALLARIRALAFWLALIVAARILLGLH